MQQRRQERNSGFPGGGWGGCHYCKLVCERTRTVRLTGIFLRVLLTGSIFLFLASVLALRGWGGGVGWGLHLCVGGGVEVKEWVGLREKVEGRGKVEGNTYGDGLV